MIDSSFVTEKDTFIDDDEKFNPHQADVSESLIPFLFHRIQNDSQYIKGPIRCIVGPWQVPLKYQGGS